MAKELNWSPHVVATLKRRNELNVEEKASLAHRMLLEVALAQTRLKPPMRRACLMVMTEGRSQADAARAVRQPRQLVNRALKVARTRLAAVEAEAEQRRAT